MFAFAAFGNRAIGQLQLFEQTWPIHEEYIDEGHSWAGRTLDELWEDRSRMLIYYLPMQTHLDLVSGGLATTTPTSGRIASLLPPSRRWDLAVNL